MPRWLHHRWCMLPWSLLKYPSTYFLSGASSSYFHLFGSCLFPLLKGSTDYKKLLGKPKEHHIGSSFRENHKLHNKAFQCFDETLSEYRSCLLSIFSHCWTLGCILASIFLCILLIWNSCQITNPLGCYGLCLAAKKGHYFDFYIIHHHCLLFYYLSIFVFSLWTIAERCKWKCNEYSILRIILHMLIVYIWLHF